MNAELTDKLITKYPVLFGGVNKSPKESLMCFGIECGSGWFQILNALCIMINNGTDMYFSASQDYPWYIRLWNHASTKLGKYKWAIHYGGKFCAPKIEFMQIKEKYGTLRVYLGQTIFDKATSEIINKYPKSTQKLLDRWHNEVDGAIQLAEDLSSITCENCGKPGEACQRGIWIATMCQECMTKEDNNGFVTCQYVNENKVE